MNWTRKRWTSVIATVAMCAVLVGVYGAGNETVRAQSVGVGDSFSADNACFVRLPDLPEPRYGGFAGFNDQTGVLFYAGGAVKRSAENTEAHYERYAIKLDGTMDAWSAIPYSQGVGYTQDFDKGCREMASVKVADANGGASVWASVGGKDGCDNGKFDDGGKGGDFGVLMEVGDRASRQGVRWVSNSGAQTLPNELAGEEGKLVRPFADFDHSRNRIIFGQGTFDDAFQQESQTEVYAATRQGSRWNVREIRPSGPTPARRYSSCAAYVQDDDQGLDGMIVLGGTEGGETGSHLKEVWWLDFSGGASGTWMEITDVFGNIDDLGYRRGGACAYNPNTKHFYSWMGRANSSVPDGASRSNGVWRTDLSNLAQAVQDDAVTLTWERLAKDNQGQLDGRRLIPSVYDWRNNRIFAIGGRNRIDEYSDVWAIYPDITGSECDNLDPYAPYAPQPTATSTQAPPTSTPDPNRPTATPGDRPTPTPLDPSAGIAFCQGIEGKVPGAARNAAAANPDGVFGYNMACNPNVPVNSLTNPLRTKLGLRNANLPYHPVFNGLVLKCGCP